MITNIKNIIFDLGGVLVDLNSQCCIQAFHKIGAAKVGEYVQDHRTEDLFLDIELGNISTETFCHEVRKIANKDIANKDIIWAWNQLLGEISIEKKQKLLSLQQYYRVFLLSNTNEIHWNKCAFDLLPYESHTANSYFEHIYLSYEMQLSKPNSEIFEAVLLQSNLIANETLFIDDATINCQSAEKLGIRTFQETTGTSWLSLF